MVKVRFSQDMEKSQKINVSKRKTKQKIESKAVGVFLYSSEEKGTLKS